MIHSASMLLNLCKCKLFKTANVWVFNFFSQLCIRHYNRRESCYQETQPTISECHARQKSLQGTCTVKDGQSQKCKWLWGAVAGGGGGRLSYEKLEDALGISKGSNKVSATPTLVSSRRVIYIFDEHPQGDLMESLHGKAASLAWVWFRDSV